MVGRPQGNGGPASKIADSGCASRSLRRQGRRGQPENPSAERASKCKCSYNRRSRSIDVRARVYDYCCLIVSTNEVDTMAKHATDWLWDTRNVPSWFSGSRIAGGGERPLNSGWGLSMLDRFTLPEQPGW